MKYPKGIKKNSHEQEIHYANRGMTLEQDLNLSNEYYRERDLAYIYKKPTPIKITKVDYPSRSKAVIKEAFFEMPSTTDYNGLYRGNYIDFEAKETKSKTSFALANVHPHQITHLRNIKQHQGICFLIVRFTSLNLTFLLPGEDFIHFIDQEQRKSIPLEYFKQKGYLIKTKLYPRIDYLSIVDQVYSMEVEKNGTKEKEVDQ